MVDSLGDDCAVLLIKLGGFHFLIQFVLFSFEGFDLLGEFFELAFFVVAEFARSWDTRKGYPYIGCMFG